MFTSEMAMLLREHAFSVLSRDDQTEATKLTGCDARRTDHQQREITLATDSR